MIDYFLQAPILYVIIFTLLIIYCIKVFIEPIFLINSLRAIWFSLIETLKQMKSVKGVILLLLTYGVISGWFIYLIGNHYKKWKEQKNDSSIFYNYDCWLIYLLHRQRTRKNKGGTR